MNKQIQQGSALLESLIAMLILTLGVMAIIGLEAKMLNQSTSARSRLLATLYAQELTALVNADSLNARCYVLPVSNQTGCTSSAASSYASNWIVEVQANLPSANTYPPTAILTSDGTFTITILWKRPSEVSTHNYIATTKVPT